MLVVFFAEGGRIRGVPVTIGGSSYIPPLPNEMDVKDSLELIIQRLSSLILVMMSINIKV